MNKAKPSVIKIFFKGFDWDLANISKLQKHRVSILEIEEFFENELLVVPDTKHSSNEERYIAVGKSIVCRRMFVAFTLRNFGRDTFIRIISARYMHKKEEKHYEKLKKSFQE